MLIFCSQKTVHGSISIRALGSLPWLSEPRRILALDRVGPIDRQVDQVSEFYYRAFINGSNPRLGSRVSVCGSLFGKAGSSGSLPGPPCLGSVCLPVGQPLSRLPVRLWHSSPATPALAGLGYSCLASALASACLSFLWLTEPTTAGTGCVAPASDCLLLTFLLH